MNMQAVKALLKKDWRLFLSNRFYLLITLVGLVFYIAAYFLLPSQGDDTLQLGIYGQEIPAAFEPQNLEEGIEITFYDDLETLKQAVRDEEVVLALALPPDILETWEAGGIPQIELYSATAATPEIREAIVKLVEELSFAQTGRALEYNTEVEILGQDMLGGQIPLRDRLVPLLASIILLVEILSLASLISTEIEQKTIRALLITPLRIPDLFMAKGIMGVSLALVQAILFMLIAGGFDQAPLVVLATLILGSLMVVGAAFLLSSLTRDVNAVTGWGLVVLIILAIPGFGAAIPGLLADWARVIPSYYLTETLNQAANYGMSWPDVYPNLIILAAISAVLLAGGMAALKRRYQ